MSVASRLSVPDAAGPIKRLGLLLLAGVLMAWAQDARACAPRLVQAPEVVRIDYDPFVFARPPGRLDLRLANDGAERCELELRLVDATGSPVREVDLSDVGVTFKPRDGSALGPGGEESGVFRLEIPAGQTVLAQLDAMVVRDAVAEAGEHRFDLFVDIAPPLAEPLIKGIPVPLLLVSPPRAQMNIAGAAGAFGSGESVSVVDFGEARTGAAKRAFLQIRANTDARVTLQSENGGVMRREESVPGGSTVPYTMSLDGEVLDLRHQVVRDLDPPRDMAGQSLPMDFVLGEIGGQMSGRYRDLITISVSPR